MGPRRERGPAMARRSILNRSFSTREKVLILVLVALLLVACYYFLVVKNVADTKAENDLQLQEIQMQIDTQTALAMARTRMENELAELGDVGKLPVVAAYDNIRNELDELNTLLSGVGTYDVKFSQPELDGELVRRPVTITYTVAGYNEALVVAGFLGCLKSGHVPLRRHRLLLDRQDARRRQHRERERHARRHLLRDDERRHQFERLG